MKKELEMKLVQDFPILYAGVSESFTQNLMCFGFECGDGWYDLIYKLSRDITTADPHAKAMQVKEKYGGLRFYIYGNDAAQDLANEAEDLSYDTCEECGKPGKERGGGWIRTLCDECQAKRE